jgi:methyltransferase (TIGR00027 family)
MLEAKPSRTAFRVALRRAAHQLIDHPKVFDDPLAVAIIGTDAAGRLESSESSLTHALRAFIAVRSRYAEDQLAAAVERGMRQYVLLGAGLDTFAYRNFYPGLRVYEVDHPATQSWKRHQLEKAAIAIPENAVLVPMNFERDKLADVLTNAGLRLGQPAFFSWLGVVPYLTESAFDETARFIASLPSPSAVVFDYALDRSALGLRERLALEALTRLVAAAGEPFQLFFEPAQLLAKLTAFGFSRCEDLDRDAINARYFQSRTDGFAIKGNLGHLCCAGN